MRKQRYLTLEKRLSVPLWTKLAVPLASIVAGFLFSAIFLLISGESSIEVYSVMFEGAFGSAYGLSETVVKMIPLMIISVGVAFAFKMQIWNAGGEGQLHIGAAAATYVVLHLNGCSRFVTVLLAFLAAFICAGIYGLIPAILKVKWKVNELITCLMLNYVATFFVSWLIQGPWKDPTGFAFPRTRKIPSAGELTTFFGTRIHTGLIIGLAIALALWFVIYKTRWGFEIKLIGAKEKVARYAGMSVNRNILLVMFLAYLAQCHPLAAVVVSFLFGGLLVGGNTIQKLGLPVSTVQMIQGSILIFVAAGGMFTKYRIVRKERRLGND